MSAVLSADELYRYYLARDGSGMFGGPSMCFVMLNPSTADAEVDDPTIRRCAGFANREGCTRFEVVNLFAYRTPYPSVLADAAKAGVDVCGPENQLYLRRAIIDHGAAPHRLVVAWGVGAVLDGQQRFVETLQRYAAPDTRVWCLGRTKAGRPRHPLMLRADTPLELWEDWR